jgi:hypothetical protein
MSRDFSDGLGDSFVADADSEMLDDALCNTRSELSRVPIG